MTARRVKKDTRWKITVHIFFLALVISVFALVWLRTALVNLKYELNNLENQKTELTRMGKIIEAEKAKAYSVEHIEESAKQMGMKVVKRENIVYVKRVADASPYKVSTKSIPWDN